MFRALRQREPGARSLPCNKSPALGQGPQGRSDTLCKRRDCAAPWRCVRVTGARTWGEGGKGEGGTKRWKLPLLLVSQLQLLIPGVGGGGGGGGGSHLFFPCPHPKDRSWQASSMQSLWTCSAWCSSWDCCPRTNLDLTLPQGNSFAHFPSLLIAPLFPVLPGYSGLGSLGVVRPSIFVEVGDLLRSELKLG